eukprot:scaffold36596_cov72-Cyclotella_meneghiniana.AAC.1
MGGGGVYLSFELSDVRGNASTYIANPSPSSSRVVGCSGVVAETVFVEDQPAEVDESEIFVFGRVGDAGANKEETEAAMTPPSELALTLGVGTTTAARGRLKSRLLLRNNSRFSRR